MTTDTNKFPCFFFFSPLLMIVEEEEEEEDHDCRVDSPSVRPWALADLLIWAFSNLKANPDL